MSNNRSKQAEELFHLAIDLPTEQRAEFLDGKCGSDATLRADVEQLLRAYGGNAGSTVVAPDRVSELIGHYRIEQEIGRGGMGVVYLATDSKLDRKVAIKLLRDDLSHDRQWLVRFQREARMAARLNHPNIATIYELGEYEGSYFIAMEYVEGWTLCHLLGSRKPMPLQDLLDIADQMAQALASAHCRNVIHRDLKPANVMLTDDGQVKIVDFGLAKALQSATTFARIGASLRLTQPGRLLGTVGYMSPEQARGNQVDARSDLFSFGAVLYEMATGTAAFHRPAAVDTISAILNDPPRSAAAHNAEIPARLDRIIETLLAKSPEDRYQSAEQVLADLRQVQRDLKIKESPTAPARADPSTSIAVLAFADMSPTKDQEYFCDGLAEELINALTQVQGLHVVARTSAFQFKDKTLDVREIGRQLNVQSILEGSVRKAGNRLRITAQLINIADGYHLWSQRYDRNLEDVFAVQDEIARTIVDTLKVKLILTRDTPLVKRYTENIEAYNLYLKGRYFWYKRHEGLIHKGIECFEQAIEMDPSYALAHAGLADSYSILGLYAFTPPRQAFAKAKAAALKAMEIDDTLAEAHFALGMVTLWFDLDRQGALRAFEHAIELSPNDAWAHCWCGQTLAFLGREEQAIAAVKRAQELDPLSPIIHAVAGIVLYWLRWYDEALMECRKASDIEPDHPSVLWIQGTIYLGMARYADATRPFERGVELTGGSLFYLGMFGGALGASGRPTEARQVMDQLIRRSKKEYVAPQYLAWIHLGLGETDQAGQRYEQACEEGNVYVWNPTDPLFDHIRSDPRFRKFWQRSGYTV